MKAKKVVNRDEFVFKPFDLVLTFYSYKELGVFSNLLNPDTRPPYDVEEIEMKDLIMQAIKSNHE